MSTTRGDEPADHSVDANKIVAGMRAAVAHAKGDETAATVHVVDRVSVLLDLARRVEATTPGWRPLLGLSLEVWAAAGWEVLAHHGRFGRAYRKVGESHWRSMPDLSSLDAVSAFTEAVLPGWMVWEIVEHDRGWWRCTLSKPRETEAWCNQAPTEAAARLAAALRALAAEAGRG